MSALDPANTTATDIVTEAYKEAGVVGVGQSPTQMDINDGLIRLQWMLQEWGRKRWLVYCLTTLSKVSTGATSYSVGPGGDIDTGAGTMRPPRIESAFLRQLTQSQPNQIDYPLEILQAREDYNKISLKQLKSFPSCVYYEPQWPLGVLYAWPVPQANIYAIFGSFLTPLPVHFAAGNTPFNIPYEYYNAMLYNLALRLRAKVGVPTYPGDMVPGLAKDGINLVRGSNTQIARLSTGDVANPRGNYNIFSDRFY